MIIVPVAYGELLDKLTILEIKAKRICDPDALGNVSEERDTLRFIWACHPASAFPLGSLIEELRAVNERLWSIEDDIRAMEHRRDFGPEFVQLARSVYLMNDERARIKRRINLVLGSGFVEEKAYCAT